MLIILSRFTRFVTFNHVPLIPETPVKQGVTDDQGCELFPEV